MRGSREGPGNQGQQGDEVRGCASGSSGHWPLPSSVEYSCLFIAVQPHWCLSAACQLVSSIFSRSLEEDMMFSFQVLRKLGLPEVPQHLKPSEPVFLAIRALDHGASTTKGPKWREDVGFLVVRGQCEGSSPTKFKVQSVGKTRKRNRRGRDV